MDGVKATLVINGIEIDCVVFDDKILFIDLDGEYEQRLDLLDSLKD